MQQPAVNFHEEVLHGETLVFITTAIVATVASRKRFYFFRETCLAKEVQKRREKFKRENSTFSCWAAEGQLTANNET